jgi:metal iron transporter
MNGFVGNLASVSRARSRSNSPAPVRYPPPVIEEISPAGVEAEGEEDEEGKKRPMDDVAAVKPAKAKTSGAGDRSKRSRPQPSLACIKAHLGHAVWDIAGSLLGFAVVVNSSILILGASSIFTLHTSFFLISASTSRFLLCEGRWLFFTLSFPPVAGAAVFYYGPYRATNPDGVSEYALPPFISSLYPSWRALFHSLFDAYALVKDYLGQSLAYLFAVALLAAGQSASLTVTLSGQIVSEGFVLVLFSLSFLRKLTFPPAFYSFINWRTKPWKRRIITRVINILPSVAVAAAVGRDGIDTLLIASQVALSIVLTFVLLPLIIFTSSHAIMAVPINPSALPPAPLPRAPSTPKSSLGHVNAFLKMINPFRRRNVPEGHISFASPVWAIWLQVRCHFSSFPLLS